MSKVYFAGLPTELDVRALWERYGVPPEGVAMPYDEVAAVIKTPVGGHRFKTVTGAWRRRLKRDHDIYLKAEGGAFTMRTPSDRVSLGALKVRTGARAFGAAVKVISMTDRHRLTAQEIAQADHLMLVGGTVRAYAVASARRVTPALPEGVKAP
jgi:hypothetical protein